MSSSKRCADMPVAFSSLGRSAGFDHPLNGGAPVWE
jgi:hypothetical protein